MHRDGPAIIGPAHAEGICDSGRGDVQCAGRRSQRAEHVDRGRPGPQRRTLRRPPARDRCGATRRHHCGARRQLFCGHTRQGCPDPRRARRDRRSRARGFTAAHRARAAHLQRARGRARRRHRTGGSLRIDHPRHRDSAQLGDCRLLRRRPRRRRARRRLGSCRRRSLDAGTVRLELHLGHARALHHHRARRSPDRAEHRGGHRLDLHGGCRRAPALGPEPSGRHGPPCALRRRHAVAHGRPRRGFGPGARAGRTGHPVRRQPEHHRNGEQQHPWRRRPRGTRTGHRRPRSADAGSRRRPVPRPRRRPAERRRGDAGHPALALRASHAARGPAARRPARRSWRRLRDPRQRPGLTSRDAARDAVAERTHRARDPLRRAGSSGHRAVEPANTAASRAPGRCACLASRGQHDRRLAAQQRRPSGHPRPSRAGP